MSALEPPDTHYFSATIGWLELGNPAEAKTELARLTQASRRNPDVLEVEWAIHAAQNDWSAGLITAQTLMQVDPKRASGWLDRAYALRRVREGGLQAAWEALEPAFEKFPDEPAIPYNLSCYACQMTRTDDARKWLQRALKIGNRELIKQMALKDADSEPLWDEIRQL
jgi:Flp pilus assembly protein TadD